jgi:hypothetical protein
MSEWHILLFVLGVWASSLFFRRVIWIAVAITVLFMAQIILRAYWSLRVVLPSLVPYECESYCSEIANLLYERMMLLTVQATILCSVVLIFFVLEKIRFAASKN